VLTGPDDECRARVTKRKADLGPSARRPYAMYQDRAIRPLNLTDYEKDALELAAAVALDA
jgi:hypothetical protein